jgi:hypothetical protein
MIILLGFTESDRDADYVSFSDGYRLGAQHVSVAISIEGDGTSLSAEQWAQAAFVASNHPGQAPPGPARAIQLAPAEQVRFPLRSRQFPDTVTVHRQTWAGESAAAGSAWTPRTCPTRSILTVVDHNSDVPVASWEHDDSQPTRPVEMTGCIPTPRAATARAPTGGRGSPSR